MPPPQRLPEWSHAISACVQAKSWRKASSLRTAGDTLREKPGSFGHSSASGRAHTIRPIQLQCRMGRIKVKDRRSLQLSVPLLSAHLILKQEITMRSSCIHRILKALACSAVALLVVVTYGSTASAQNNTPPNNANNANNANNNGNVNALAPAGVEVDVHGVLRVKQNDPRVSIQRAMAARRDLPTNLASRSKLRKVSLNRLEKQLAEDLAAGKRPERAMLALAGLTRIEYVFFYPDSGEIVIAGPAEGFFNDSTGRVVGIESGKPTLLLEDLVVALRAFPPTGDSSNVISVSIDPTQEGLKRMNDAVRQIGGAFQGPQQVPLIANTLRQSLGLQTVSIRGISPNTHFAHILTEADYRMKLIGIGLESPTVPLITYVSKLSIGGPANALIRWYFVPNYEALAVSEDGLAMKLVGQGVKLIGEDELVRADGSRDSSTKSNAASKAFTADFTKKFQAIAETNPIYAQLRNMIDMSIVAAYMQDRHFYDQANWDLGVLGRESDFSVEVLPAPKQVETAVNAIMKGNRLVTPIGGGVAIEARKALNENNLQSDDGTIQTQRSKITLENIPADQWWWD